MPSTARSSLRTLAPRARWPALPLLLALGLLHPPALQAGPAAPAAAAAAEPDTRSMIEALMPAKTRSMRNLQVRQKPGDAGPAAAGIAPAASAGEPLMAPAAPGSAAAALAGAVAVPAGPAPNLSLSIQFEANSSRVRPESGPLLGSLVAAMQSPELKGSRFLIEGHTDPRGTAAANLRLSQERADEVRLYLVALGVHPARLRAVGKGASEPARPGDPTARENRRVRVVTVE